MYETGNYNWDTDKAAIGGSSHVNFVVSPYSNVPSANASQGHLTYGTLSTMYNPPKIMIRPSSDGYYVNNRFDMSTVNERAYNVHPHSMSNGCQVNESSMRSKESFEGIPGLRGSEHHVERFKASDTPILILLIVLFVIISFYAICRYLNRHTKLFLPKIFEKIPFYKSLT